MTPKEKAKELFDKFFIHSDTNNEIVGYYFHTKQCALIAVNEIIKELKDEIWFYNCDDTNIDKRELYWQEVKQEIENL